ncbi:hypothetical protein BGZ60DRAFT_430030 [Tricladium varicosporioides]|nr:hypothetical protein BGZ60DRAFT_430030 [Hymenoscyphus varicosporioides]
MEPKAPSYRTSTHCVNATRPCFGGYTKPFKATKRTTKLTRTPLSKRLAINLLPNFSIHCPQESEESLDESVSEGESLSEKSLSEDGCLSPGEKVLSPEGKMVMTFEKLQEELHLDLLLSDHTGGNYGFWSFDESKDVAIRRDYISPCTLLSDPRRSSRSRILYPGLALIVTQGRKLPYYPSRPQTIRPEANENMGRRRVFAEMEP